MSKFFVTCVLLFSVTLWGCGSTPVQNTAPIIPVELIPLERAQDLITSGQVTEIFQPHRGCVVLTLQNGEYLSFEQPHLDWVLTFVDEAGLTKSISILIE
jgi:hypothetical protein